MASGRYLQIAEQLREDLPKYGPGDRFLSENQIAVRYSVSRPTAARALAELCHEGLVERRVGSGTYVSPGSLGTRSGPMRTIGLMLSGLGATDIWDPLSVELTRACARTGVSLRIGLPLDPKDDIEFSRKRARDLLAQRIDGVLYAPMEDVPDREAANLEICDMFVEAGVPVVLIDRDIVDFPHRSQFDIVGVDNLRGGAQLAEYMIGLGYRRPAFFSRPKHPTTTDERIAGYASVFLAAGVQLDPGWHVEGDPGDPELLGEILSQRRPDVLVASNDHTAARLIQTLTRMGVEVPQDIGVVGFDDTTYSQLLTVPLTTVRQPFGSIAAAALRALFDRMVEADLDPVEILVAPKLIPRESTRRQDPRG